MNVQNAVVIVILVVIIAAAVMGTIDRFRFGSSCCGTGTNRKRKFRFNTLRRIFSNIFAKGRMKNMSDFSEKTLSIEGMMCEHCERAVKNALESIDGVAAAQVSREKNQAVVKLSKDVTDEALKTAVEEEDYRVVGIA